MPLTADFEMRLASFNIHIISTMFSFSKVINHTVRLETTQETCDSLTNNTTGTLNQYVDVSKDPYLLFYQ